MHTLAYIAVGAIALVQLGLLVLQMFLWDRAAGLRVFEHDQDFASATRELAANQGLYNGFLAAGLFWGLDKGNAPMQQFFLVCVLLAGIYGALTTHARMLWAQAAPAALALLLLALA